MLASFKPLIAGDLKPQVGHYHVIDLVRGLAACAILLWHYQDFIALGTAEPGSRGGYPLYDILALFYEQGGTAVQLFWIISGFVFSAVYMGKGVSSRTFFEHRVARLYPLHIVTLFVVAGLQVLCLRTFGTHIIYTENTATDFGLHLIMATGWGIGGSHSFNGPIWSVSAEVFIYALFWLSLRFLFRWRLAVPLVLSAAFFLLRSESPIAACGAYFFLGCAVYVAHRIFPQWAQYLAASAGALVFAAFLHYGFQGIGLLFLFAGITLFCAAIEKGPASQWAASVPWLADNTYGVYLWHIPIQLVMILGLNALGIGPSIAYSPWFLLLFIVAVTVVARVSYLFIEKPARDFVRNGFARPRRVSSLARSEPQA